MLVSGGFDPVHKGHLEMIEKASEMAEEVWVILNNDFWLTRKKGKPFMDERDRMKIVSAIQWVDEVFLSIDTDKTVCKSLEEIKPDIFTNGGDRHNQEIPESVVSRKYGIELLEEWVKKLGVVLI